MGWFSNFFHNPVSTLEHTVSKNVLPIAETALAAWQPELIPLIAAGGAAYGATQNGLMGAIQGGLQGYGAGQLGAGLGTFGSALGNGASIGNAFSQGFPTIAGIGHSIENGASSLGNSLGSMFGGTAPASDMGGLTSTGMSSSLLTPAGMANQEITGGINAAQNPLDQALASQAASSAGGASNTLNSAFNTGDTLSGLSGSSPVGSAASAGANLTAGGGGASAFSNLGAGGGSMINPESMLSPSAIGDGLANTATAGMPTAAATASTGGSGMNIGSILSGVSGLTNAYTNNKAQNQLMAQQELNQKQMAPFLAAGTSAAGNLQGLLNPGTSAASLASTPGYQFELQQGNNALNNQMAASGLTGSGAALKAAQQFGQGLAGTTYQNAISNALAGSNLGIGAGAINSGYNTGIGNIGALTSQGQNQNLLASLAGIFGGKQSGLNSFSF